MLDGYCWASNSFLDGTKSGRNASRFIAELRNSGYISIKNERSKSRKIRICQVDSKVNPANSGDVEGSENANLANSGEVEGPENANLANSGEVDEPGKTDSANFGEVEKAENANLANSGEVKEPENANPANSGDRSSSSINIHKKTTTTSVPEKPYAAAAPLSPNKIKTALLSLDNSLIFGGMFYVNAAAFMAERGLGPNYLEWLHEQCRLKEKLRNLKAYYFSIFFLDNVAEEYKAARLPEPSGPEPPPPVICEACGEAHARSDAKCPSCGLPEYSNTDEILFYRELHKLDPQKREDFFNKRAAVFDEYGNLHSGYDFEKLKSSLSALKQEYGLETPS